MGRLGLCAFSPPPPPPAECPTALAQPQPDSVYRTAGSQWATLGLCLHAPHVQTVRFVGAGLAVAGSVCYSREAFDAAHIPLTTCDTFPEAPTHCPNPMLRIPPPVTGVAAARDCTVGLYLRAVHCAFAPPAPPPPPIFAGYIHLGGGACRPVCPR